MPRARARGISHVVMGRVARAPFPCSAPRLDRTSSRSLLSSSAVSRGPRPERHQRGGQRGRRSLPHRDASIIEMSARPQLSRSVGWARDRTRDHIQDGEACLMLMDQDRRCLERIFDVGRHHEGRGTLAPLALRVPSGHAYAASSARSTFVSAGSNDRDTRDPSGHTRFTSGSSICTSTSAPCPSSPSVRTHDSTLLPR